MVEMASLWGYDYEENQDMEQLGQKLLFTALQLEKLKSEAVDEMTKNKEYIQQLIHLLKYAIQERDEARNQIHALLNKTNTCSPTIPPFPDDDPPIRPGKANSSITESHSPSDTLNYNSQGESFFDEMPSPGFSSINLVASRPWVQESSNRVNSRVVPDVGQGSLIIDNLMRGRVLPEKGKFVQAVLRAGPLLQTLLVAGPLPTWRNPPLMQPLQIPPASTNSCGTEVFCQKPASILGHMAPRSLNSQPYAQISCGGAPVRPTSMLNFANLGSGTCFGNASLISSGTDGSSYAPLSKKLRFI